MDRTEAEEVLLAKILVYAPSTWAAHASAFKEFQKFCEVRSINPFECVPHMLNVFLLSLAQKNFSMTAIDSKLNSIAFCFKFFMVYDITKDVVVEPIKKFVMKVCPRNTNLKKPFGSVEIRKCWDFIDLEKLDSYDVGEVFLFPPLS
jgi:hypothetical protein